MEDGFYQMGNPLQIRTYLLYLTLSLPLPTLTLTSPQIGADGHDISTAFGGRLARELLPGS